MTPVRAFACCALAAALSAFSVGRFDMGLVIGSGLTIGALFSLYVVPAIYTYLATDKSAARATAAGTVPVA